MKCTGCLNGATPRPQEMRAKKQLERRLLLTRLVTYQQLLFRYIHSYSIAMYMLIEGCMTALIVKYIVVGKSTSQIITAMLMSRNLKLSKYSLCKTMNGLFKDALILDN